MRTLPTNEKKGITVKIDADLHAEIREYLEKHEMTMAEFITLATQDELHPKLNLTEEKNMANMRTLAFQVPEELFHKIKDYLQRNNMTQKEFVIGLIETEIERDLAQRAVQSETQNQSEEETEEEQTEQQETAAVSDCESSSEKVEEELEGQESTKISDDFEEEDEELDADEDLNELEEQNEYQTEEQEETEEVGMTMGM
ncbi:MAG: hypothetical protein NC452_07275 [Eubacterium sp.]|nr:hypothetical protein [Eubacterium sp.]